MIVYDFFEMMYESDDKCWDEIRINMYYDERFNVEFDLDREITEYI